LQHQPPRVLDNAPAGFEYGLFIEIHHGGHGGHGGNGGHGGERIYTELNVNLRPTRCDLHDGMPNTAGLSAICDCCHCLHNGLSEC
jgi:hypothetical protein